MQNFKPERYQFCDSWQFSDGEKVHCFYLKCLRPDTMEDPVSGSIGHLVSDDMLHWQELPEALCRDADPEKDDYDLWTGCTIRHKEKWYLFYTWRNHRSHVRDAIGVAISEDGLHWRKYADNPIIEPDPRYYCSSAAPTPLAVHANPTGDLVDCRDLCVVWDARRQHWWGYFAVRRPGSECTGTSVIGLARSYDLLHWEQLPPCFCPDKYHCIETPDVFELNGKWYMLCLSGNHYGQRNRTGDPNLTGCITIYAAADAPEGPYRECYESNVLLGSQEGSGFCAKTVLHQGRRYLSYTQAQTGADRKLCLSFPKEVRTHDDGSLALGWFDGVEGLYQKSICPDPSLVNKNRGQWGSLTDWQFDAGTITAAPQTDWAVCMFDITARDFVAECTIVPGDALGAGIVFDVAGEDIYSDNLLALLDLEQQEVWLTKTRVFRKLNARRSRLTGELPMKVLAVGSSVEIYLNGELVLHHQLDRTGGRIGLFADTGKVIFRDVRFHLI